MNFQEECIKYFFFLFSVPEWAALENDKLRSSTVSILKTEMPIILMGVLAKLAAFKVVLRILHMTALYPIFCLQS